MSQGKYNEKTVFKKMLNIEDYNNQTDIINLRQSLDMTLCTVYIQPEELAMNQHDVTCTFKQLLYGDKNISKT